VRDDSSDSETEASEFADGQDLCLPALHYIRLCCDIIASMCRMPACPTFTGAQRYYSLLTSLVSFSLITTLCYAIATASRPAVSKMMYVRPFL